jgi:PPOX class probable FMN-dependent enzyme
MLTVRFEDVITTDEQLRAITGEPSGRAVDKVLERLDKHCISLIEHSPFMLIASTDEAGNLDVSPKGDPPGFVRVLDDRTLAIPDRKGNRRADTFSNVLKKPHVALLFMVPGFRETLRVTGTAQVVRDTELRVSMAVNDSAPDLVLVVSVTDSFFHCAKCVIRSGIWQPDSWMDVSDMPTFGTILKDQTHAHEPAEDVDAQIAESYRNRLY